MPFSLLSDLYILSHLTILTTSQVAMRHQESVEAEKDKEMSSTP